MTCFGDESCRQDLFCEENKTYGKGVNHMRWSMKKSSKCDLLEYLSQRAVISEVFCDGVG